MSENVELVRSIFAERERGNNRSVGWAHPEMEWVIADGPSAGSWIGVTAMVQSVSSMLDAWAVWHVEADEYRELDGERVLVLTQMSGRGKMSGVEVRTNGASVYHLRDSSVTKIVTYYDRAHAFADLGLEE